MADHDSQMVVHGSGNAKRAAQLEVQTNYAKAQHVAGLCRELAERTATTIQGNKYIPAATWEAIAVAHGCVVGTRDVQWVPPSEGMAGGFRCIAEIKSQQTGAVLAEAEGFVGTDEPVWFGGETEYWDKHKRPPGLVKKVYPKRHDSAIRAMTQTRAAGRVCKQAFAHVVVLMNAGLSTTPLEEVGDPDSPENRPSDTTPVAPKGDPIYEWKDVRIHFGKKHGPGCDAEHPQGKQLGELSTAALRWFQNDWQPQPYNGNPPKDEDLRLRRALDISMGKAEPDQRPGTATQAELVNDVPAGAKQASANEPPE